MSKSAIALLAGSVLVVGYAALSPSEPSIPTSQPATVAKTQETLTAPPVKQIVKETQRMEPKCHPSYSGCLNPNASDYDCAGGSGNGPYYTGAVQVIGPDVFGLDRDNDGWGCE